MSEDKKGNTKLVITIFVCIVLLVFIGTLIYAMVNDTFREVFKMHIVPRPIDVIIPIHRMP